MDTDAVQQTCMDRDPLLNCASPTVPVADLHCLARRKESCGPAASSVRGPCRGGGQQSPGRRRRKQCDSTGLCVLLRARVDEFTLEFIDDAAE
jgi:hypothetical protein